MSPSPHYTFPPSPLKCILSCSKSLNVLACSVASAALSLLYLLSHCASPQPTQHLPQSWAPSTEGMMNPCCASPKVPGRLAHPPMDWKPPDFFFFLFWARTISRVSGSTSEVHSEVGKVGRGLPGPSWEGGTERQRHPRHNQTTGDRERDYLVVDTPPFKPMMPPPGHMTSLLKGSPTTGPGQGRGSECGPCRLTA